MRSTERPGGLGARYAERAGTGGEGTSMKGSFGTLGDFGGGPTFECGDIEVDM